MSVVKLYNKQRNVTYVYESVSYWDKELKQPRSHRKLIGKLDPVTGECIQTHKKKKELPLSDTPVEQVADSTPNYENLYFKSVATIKEKDASIAELEAELAHAQQLIRCQLETIRHAGLLLSNTILEAEKMASNG